MKCSGRRYPNAPAVATCGCLERPPPHFFGMSVLPFEGSGFEFLESHLWVPWHHFERRPSAQPFDVTNFWRMEFTLAPFDYRIEVSTFRLAGVWTLRSDYYRLGPAPIGRSMRFRLSFPSGFPKWETIMLLPRVSVIGWPWLQPSQVTVQIGQYAFIPAGTCDS